MTRLTEEMVIARSKQSDLSTIKKLNCWGSDLSDVSIIKRMRGVEVLALSVNKISTLQPFEDCIKLQELYLRKNNIQDINEIAYLQNLPALKYLWLEENPCCERAGPNYRLVVLQALPNLKKLDNVEVTPEEIEDATRAASNANSTTHRGEEALCEDSYEQQQQHPPHSHHQQFEQQSQPVGYQSQHRSHYQQQAQQQQQPPQQYAARRSSSPMKETAHQTGPENAEESLSEPLNQTSIPSSPSQRSPGSDQESSPHAGYRERAPIPPSMSTHSMKEYYQSDRPAYPSHYRHSQTDLTEWEEHQQHQQYSNNAAMVLGPRRSAGAEREMPERYAHRNGHARENGDWEEPERPKPRRPDGRFSDSASTVSTAVLNHYTGYHRRPINRSSNLLSATLCLVKELDYSSLEVVEHAVRCRIDELAD